MFKDCIQVDAQYGNESEEEKEGGCLTELLE